MRLLLVRWGGLAMILSGLLFIFEGMPHISNPPAWSIPVWAEEGMLLAGYLLLALGLLSLHGLQGGLDGMLGRLGAWMEGIGLAGAAVAVAGSLVGADLEWLHGGGFVVAVVGMLLAGIGTVRAGRLPGWCGGALIAAAILAFFPVEYSIVLLGLALLPLGGALWMRRAEGQRVQLTS